MKCHELKEICDQVAVFTRAASGRVGGLESLAALLSVHQGLTVTQLSKAIAKIGDLEICHQEPLIVNATEYADLVRKMLCNVAKKAVIDDLACLSAALASHDNTNVDVLLAALRNVKSARRTPLPNSLRNDVVQKYLHALENSLGDDAGFATIFKNLESDPLVQQAEAVALCKRFAFSSVKSRSAALKKIWSRHQSLMISRAKSAATAGRIAG